MKIFDNIEIALFDGRKFYIKSEEYVKAAFNLEELIMGGDSEYLKILTETQFLMVKRTFIKYINITREEKNEV